MVCEIEKLNERDADAILNLWEPINQRNEYGSRTEICPSRCTILKWNNGTASWFVRTYRTVSKDIEIWLDADEVLTPFSPMRLERIKDCLPKLPLYQFSLQAKESLTEKEREKRTLEWAKRMGEYIDTQKRYGPKKIGDLVNENKLSETLKKRLNIENDDE